MKSFFDMHCDLPTKIYNSNENIVQNSCHWSLDKICCDEFMQFFACFIDSKTVKYPFEYASDVLKSFKKLLVGHIHLAKNFEDVSKNKKCGILTIEGGEALCGKISNLEYFYNLGVRLLTLTWNYENELGYGAMESNPTKPLKRFGIDVIKHMEKIGMIIDVSHLNEGGFWSVSENTDCPFVASHSNAKAICDNPRNLTDLQIKTIIKKGGLIGINFYPPFLSNKFEASINDILRHIYHILSLGGENHIVFGADFDGVDFLPKSILNISSLDYIAEEMQKNHFSNEIIAKIYYLNGKNILKKFLR